MAAAASALDVNLDPSRIGYHGGIQGRFYLKKWFETEYHSHLPVCATKAIQPDGMTVMCAYPADIGDRAFVYLDGFGVLTGTVRRSIGSITNMSIETTEEGRARLATRILWLDQRAHFRSSDNRQYPRYRPINPNTTVRIGTGAPAGCRVENMSPSGAAVESEARPELNTKVILGMVHGQIVRHTDTGFAVRFDVIQDPMKLDSLVAPDGDGAKVYVFQRPTLAAETFAAPQEFPAPKRLSRDLIVLPD